MTKLEQAARQALEALEMAVSKTLDYIQKNHLCGAENNHWIVQSKKAITALREALAKQERKTKYDERFERLEKFEQQAKQEPVAYLCPSFVDNYATGRYETCEQKDYGAFPVYAAPLAQQDTHATHVVRTKDPCHPWQDLTDDEIEKAFWGNGDTEIEGCRAVIEKFKEKNNVK